MKNKVLKIIFVFAFLLIFITNSVFAAGKGGTTGAVGAGTGTGKGAGTGTASAVIGQYGQMGEGNAFTADAKKTVDNLINRSIYITKLITLTVSIVMLILLGVKYVSASPGEKAEVKKHLTVYVVGAVVAFGAYGILDIVQQFATSL